MLQALFDLEATNNELKADLRDLYITAAKEVDAGSRKAIIVHVSLREQADKFQEAAAAIRCWIGVMGLHVTGLAEHSLLGCLDGLGEGGLTSCWGCFRVCNRLYGAQIIWAVRWGQ